MVKRKKRNVLLIGAELQGMDNFDLSMEELASLVRQLGRSLWIATGKNRKSMTPRPSLALVSWKRLRRMVDLKKYYYCHCQ